FVGAIRVGTVGGEFKDSSVTISKTICTFCSNSIMLIAWYSVTYPLSSARTEKSPRGKLPKISKLPFSSVKTVVVAGVVVILTLANGSFVASKRTLPVKVPFALPSITSSLQLIKISERKVIIKKYIDFIFYKIYCCYLPRYICIPMPYC